MDIIILTWRPIRDGVRWKQEEKANDECDEISSTILIVPCRTPHEGAPINKIDQI